MGFKDKKGNPIKKLSLKSKIIVFLCLSIIVAAIAYKTSVDNKANSKNLIEKLNNLPNSGDDTKSFIKGQNEQNNEAKIVEKLEDRKNNKLEELYEESYKLFGQKKYTDTIKLADQMIAEDSNFYKAYNIKGIALCYSNNYRDGMNNIDKALELKSDFGYARFNKALAYELYGKYDDSLIWYDKALEVENYIWSYYGKASIYGRRGDIENTIKYLKVAISMSPDIKQLAKDEADFNPVKNSREFQELTK